MSNIICLNSYRVKDRNTHTLHHHENLQLSAEYTAEEIERIREEFLKEQEKMVERKMQKEYMILMTKNIYRKRDDNEYSS